MATKATNGHKVFPGSYHRLTLEPDEVLVPEGWHEAAINKAVQGKELDATVPVGALGPDRKFLPVKVIQVEDQEIRVVLPVGNDGTQMWWIPVDDFYQMLVDAD